MNYTAEKKDMVCDFTPDSKCDEYFLYKHLGWAYEKEWRIIQQTEEPYFCYGLEDLACIIVGCRIKGELLEIIQKYISENIPIMKAFPGYYSFGVKVEPLGHNHNYDGSVEGIIYNTEELLQYIEAKRL